MKKTFIAASALALAVASCGGNTAEISITFNPTGGAINQAIDVAVTAKFSAAVAESDLPLVMGLFKNAAGSSLCTSFTYNGDSCTATCNHDPLEYNTSYTTAIQPFLLVRGGTAAFTTVVDPLADVAADTEADALKDAAAEETAGDAETTDAATGESVATEEDAQ